MRIALLSMDLEEWYDLKYLESKVRRRERSTADGASVFLDALERHGRRGTCFVLGSFWRSNPGLVREIADRGHEIALHGADHRLLYEMSDAEFTRSTRAVKQDLEDALGRPVDGFRASCFSMTRGKLDLLPELGFRYDSSRIDAATQYRGEALDLSGWRRLEAGAWERGGFVEFGLTTTSVLGRVVSVAGGGYFRLLPWPLFRLLLAKALREVPLYAFYLHPFETSRVRVRASDVAWSLRDRVRYAVGRGRTVARLERLLAVLGSREFASQTYAEARRTLLARG